MENYNLGPNETVLFKCTVEDDTEVILTNINLVLIKTTKKLFSKSQISVTVYSNSDIKFYNGIPQVKQVGFDVEIFLTTTELTVAFLSKSDAHKFVNEVFELLTGKTIGERSADKVKNAIGLVDDTLGIDSVGTVKNVLENGIPKNIFNVLKKVKQPQVTPDTAQVANASDSGTYVEKLKRLKELLDMGLITQEEFDTKKQDILNHI